MAWMCKAEPVGRAQWAEWRSLGPGLGTWWEMVAEKVSDVVRWPRGRSGLTFPFFSSRILVWFLLESLREPVVRHGLRFDLLESEIPFPSCSSDSCCEGSVDGEEAAWTISAFGISRSVGQLAFADCIFPSAYGTKYRMGEVGEGRQQSSASRNLAQFHRLQLAFVGEETRTQLAGLLASDGR